VQFCREKKTFTAEIQFMKHPLSELKPSLLWNHFYHLTQIPRPSHHETAVQAYVRGFGEARGLQTLVDDHGNVLIRKPATPGREGRPGVILQGHLDMVPQANAATAHDFTSDPIRTRIDGDWLAAEGTTLGADNGIGVAAALAVLETDAIRHGPIEALFTSNEEDGMTGAFNLDPALLQGSILLNLDSEEEGEFSIGCAGGVDATARIAAPTVPVAGDFRAFRVAVRGLRGGHSGVDIHLERGNANSLLFRLLRELAAVHGARLCEVSGGNMRNAIPREANALVAVPQEQAGPLGEAVARYQAIYRAELSVADPGVALSADPVELPTRWLEERAQQQLIHLVCACPHGVMRMSDAMPGLVETSNNLAIVRSMGGEVEIQCLLRSSVDTAREALCGRISSLFALAGVAVRFNGAYPGWQPNPDSSLLQLLRETYADLHGRAARVGAIHAGLECGIIGGLRPDLDMISFGPTIQWPHSPDERVHIPSVLDFWELLLATLENV
jgi:dipeptidase D